MAKLTTTDISNITGAETTAITNINNNFAAVETAMENTLSRDGTSPNQMNADLDMNHNDILNIDILDIDRLILDGKELVIPGPEDNKVLGWNGNTLVNYSVEDLGAIAKGIIKVAEQPGLTVTERLNHAFAISSPGDMVIGELSGVITESITIPGGIKLFWNDMRTELTSSSAVIVSLSENADNTIIYNLDIDAGGTTLVAAKNTEAAFRASGPKGLWLVNPRIRNWSYYGFDIKSSTERGLSDVFIINPRMSDPSAYVTTPILVRSVTGGLFGENVHVIGGNLWGTDPDNPTLADYTSTNEYTADFITFQGINGGSITNTSVRYSGSAGVSTTRGSKNIIHRNVLTEMCYEPGFNGGSGLEIIHVLDRTGFILASGVTSIAGGVTGGTISAIVNDVTGNGAWLWIESVTGGIFELGDDVVQGAISSVVNTAGTGEREAGRSVIYSGFNLEYDDCHSVDTVIQGGAAAYNLIRCRGGTRVHNCTYDNPRGQGAATYFLTNSHSVIGFGSDNKWKCRPVNNTKLLTSGAYSWLYKNTAAAVLGEMSLVDFGGYEGDAAANRTALTAAIAYFTASGGGCIRIPFGYWPVSAGTNFYVLADNIQFAGEGAGTLLEFTSCGLIYDGVIKGSHLYKGGLRDISIARTGTAGPVLLLNGQNGMGVSRFGLTNVHVKESSAKAGHGVVAKGAWSSWWNGGSISGCDSGFRAELAVDGNSSANAWYLNGLEIQGNNWGVDLDSPAVIDIVATIEGNTSGGIIGRNNIRGLRARLYCEGNGSGAGDRDVLIQDPAYGGTANTGYGCEIGGYFSDAGKGKNAAIQVGRSIKLRINDGSFNNYAMGAVMSVPDGGVTSRVSMNLADLSLLGTTPYDVVDVAGTKLFNQYIKRATHRAVRKYTGTFDPPSVASGATGTVAVTITGVKSGDLIIGSDSAANRLGCEVYFRCSADDEVTMYVSNGTARANDIGAAVWTLTVAEKDFFTQ